MIRNRRGVTLIELTVVIGVIAIVLSSLCGIYFAISREWERAQGEGAALDATSLACRTMGDYISQGVSAIVIDRFATRDVLAINLPADGQSVSQMGAGDALSVEMGNVIYVPFPSGDELQYRSGVWIIFYLSDSTGSYGRSGNILWSGLTNSPGVPSSITPNQPWSMYANNVGKITPISAIAFTQNTGRMRSSITMTITSSYTINKVSNSQKQMTQSATVCLMNNGPQ